MIALQGVSFRAACPAPSGVLGNGRNEGSLRSELLGQKLYPGIALAGRQTVRASLGSGNFPFFVRKPSVAHRSHSVSAGLKVGQLGVHCLRRKRLPASVEGESNRPQQRFDSCHPAATSSSISPPEVGTPVKPTTSERGPWWAPGEWLAAVLRKAGPVLTAVCLALALILVKPSSAFATSQLARPPSVTAVYNVKTKQCIERGLSAGVVPSQAATERSKSPVLDTEERSVLRVDSSSLAPLREDVSAPATCPSNQFRLPGLASLSQSVSLLPAHSTTPSTFPRQERISVPISADHETSQPSTSTSHEPQSKTSRSSSSAPASSFEQTKASQQSPILEDLFRKGGSSLPSGGASSSSPPDGSNNSDGKKGVQQREKLDVYFLPDQIPKPKMGEWVSDQGRFLEPPWIPARINQIVNGLKKDTETEIVVVAINALGKHAGVPEMVAAELCAQWQVGGPQGDGLLILYVNRGGTSWERTEEGIAMNVPYKRQLAVKVLPGLEKKLEKWGRKRGKKSAREAVDDVRKTLMVKMGGGEVTAGEVILEGVASTAEKVWAAEGKRIPANIRKDPREVARRTNIEWFGIVVLTYVVWSWADKGNRLSAGLGEVSPWIGGALDRVMGRLGPPCGVCGESTVLRSKATPEAIADAGARKESELRSMEYYAYECENLDCKGPQEQRRNLVGWPIPFRAKKCPGCGYRTVTQISEPVRRAGLVTDGAVRRINECKNCGVKGERVMRDSSFLRGLSLWGSKKAESTVTLPKSNEGSGGSGSIQPAGS